MLRPKFGFAFTVLGLCLASGLALADERGDAAGSPTLIENGPVLQGPVLQGPVLQGPVLQGPVLQGPVLQGPVLQGPVLQGPALNHASSVRVVGIVLAGS